MNDGLDVGHEDLSPNYVAADSFDFDQNDPDPSPVFSDDRHGTAVSGVVASCGDNVIGTTGAAPDSSLDWQTPAAFAAKLKDEEAVGAFSAASPADPPVGATPLPLDLPAPSIPILSQRLVQKT